MSVKRSRAEQADATRRALVERARRLFAERGFAAASMQEIVSQERLTKGALYHHFEDKLDLYRAVVEEVEREIVAHVEEQSQSEGDPTRRLERMCETYLEAVLDSDVARILVLEAPTVLGWKAWCDLSQEHEVAAFCRCLREMSRAEEGRRPAESTLETTAQVLLGALNTAARLVATADDPVAAREQAQETIGRLLSGLQLRLSRSPEAASR